MMSLPPLFLWPMTVITRISIMVIISLRWSLTTNCPVRTQSCHTVCVTCPCCCHCSCRSSPTVTQMAVASKLLLCLTFLLPWFFCTPFRRVFPKHLGNSDFQGLCGISTSCCFLPTHRKGQGINQLWNYLKMVRAGFRQWLRALPIFSFQPRL